MARWVTDVKLEYWSVPAHIEWKRARHVFSGVFYSLQSYLDKPSKLKIGKILELVLIKIYPPFFLAPKLALHDVIINLDSSQESGTSS